MEEILNSTVKAQSNLQQDYSYLLFSDEYYKNVNAYHMRGNLKYLFGGYTITGSNFTYLDWYIKSNDVLYYIDKAECEYEYGEEMEIKTIPMKELCVVYRNAIDVAEVYFLIATFLHLNTGKRYCVSFNYYFIENDNDEYDVDITDIDPNFYDTTEIAISNCTRDVGNSKFKHLQSSLAYPIGDEDKDHGSDIMYNKRSYKISCLLNNSNWS